MAAIHHSPSAQAFILATRTRFRFIFLPFQPKWKFISGDGIKGENKLASLRM
jgi:hypothetical protein